MPFTDFLKTWFGHVISSGQVFVCRQSPLHDHVDIMNIISRLFMATRFACAGMWLVVVEEDCVTSPKSVCVEGCMRRRSIHKHLDCALGPRCSSRFFYLFGLYSKEGSCLLFSWDLKLIYPWRTTDPFSTARLLRLAWCPYMVWVWTWLSDTLLLWPQEFFQP